MGVPMGAAGLMLGGSAINMVGQKQSADAQSAYYNYLSQTATENAGLAKSAGAAQNEAVGMAAGDQMRRSVQNSQRTIGAQKVTMARGVGDSSRSAQDIIGNTANMESQNEQAINMTSEMKAKAIFANADMAAFNANSQATGYGMASNNIKSALPYQMFGSLLGGSAQAASMYTSMRALA